MLMVGVVLTAQNVTTIGGTTSFDNSVVVNGYYNYSKYQYIYESSEVGTGGVITKIGYYVGDYYLGENTGTIQNVTLRVGHTSMDHFSSSAYSSDASNLVFTGNLTFSLGWNWVVLDQSFNYNGIDNLIIEFRSEDGDWFDNPIPEFAYETLPFGEVNYKRVGGKSDYDNPPSPLRGKNRASIQLNFSSVYTPLTVTGTVTNETCTSPGSGTVSLNVTGGTPPYFYQWTNGQTTPTATNLGSGVITVTVTDASELQQQVQKTFTISKVIEWEYLAEITSSGNSITKTGIDDYYNSWARSKNELVGDGEMSFTIKNLTDYYIIGLSSQKHTEGSYYVIDYGWEQYGGYMYFDDYYSYLTPQVGDEFTVKREGTNITTLHNGVQVGPSKYIPLGTPLYLEASIKNQGTSINDIYMDFCTPLTASYISYPVTKGLSDGAIDVSVEGGYPPYSFLWGNGATTEDLEMIQFGTYQVQITDLMGSVINLTPNVTYRPTWSSLVNLEANGSDISRDQNTIGVNTRATSENRTANDGYIKFKINDVNDEFIIGFSSQEHDESNYYATDYALEMYGGYLWVTEASTFYLIYTDVFPGDELKLERVGTEIKYYLNDIQIDHVSTVPANQELLVEAAIETPGASIQGIELNFARPDLEDYTQYYPLERYLNHSYVNLENNALHFVYDEEYLEKGEQFLKFKIIDKSSQIVYSSDETNVAISKGLNKIKLGCISEKIGDTGFFTLITENEKGDESFLRFKVDVVYYCNNNEEH